MRYRGQTTIELFLLLAVSLVALSIIYSLYSDQIFASSQAREVATSRATISRLVDSANSLAISGAGSKDRVLVDLPLTLKMNFSIIRGSTLVLRLHDGTDVIGSADVNFSGDWKKQNGIYLTGAYYATLVFDGNSVNIYYDDFDLSNESISMQARQGSVVQGSFGIRNNSSRTANFTLTPNYSHGSFAVLSLDPALTSFFLDSGESKTIDFNIALSGASSGNYAGVIGVLGRLNDGASDFNISKQVVVSVESFLSISQVLIYPSLTPFSSSGGSLVGKSFSVCNSGASLSTISWSRRSNADANMLSWFNFPPADASGQITIVAGGSCRNFDLNFSVPPAALGAYDANITATGTDGNAFTVFVHANIS